MTERLGYFIGGAVAGGLLVGGGSWYRFEHNYENKLDKAKAELGFTVTGSTVTTQLGAPEATVITVTPPAVAVAPVSKPVPPASFESGIVCTGPVPDQPDIIIDEGHASIFNKTRNQNTLSVLVAFATAPTRGHQEIRGSFDEAHAHAFARDVARLNGIPVDGSFDPDNFPSPALTGKSAYFFPTSCKVPVSSGSTTPDLIVA